MWVLSLGVRYQSSLVLIPRNNQYEAIAPLYLLLSSLPSSEIGDHDTKTDGCVWMCVHALVHLYILYSMCMCVSGLKCLAVTVCAGCYA